MFQRTRTNCKIAKSTLRIKRPQTFAGLPTSRPTPRFKMTRRQVTHTSTPRSNLNPNYRVLTEVFGDDPVSRALYRRRVPDDGTFRPPAQASSSPDDEDSYSPSDEESLVLAIGILRTLMNEDKITPDDIRRVARRWRGEVFGDSGAYEGRSASRRTEELGYKTTEEEAEAVVVTDDEISSSESATPTSSSSTSRKEPPRRESSVRKLNPPKKMKSVAASPEACPQ